MNPIKTEMFEHNGKTYEISVRKKWDEKGNPDEDEFSGFCNNKKIVSIKPKSWACHIEMCQDPVELLITEVKEQIVLANSR